MPAELKHTPASDPNPWSHAHVFIFAVNFYKNFQSSLGYGKKLQFDIFVYEGSDSWHTRYIPKTTKNINEFNWLVLKYKFYNFHFGRSIWNQVVRARLSIVPRDSVLWE